MPASPKAGNTFVPVSGNTISGPVRIYGLFINGGASGGTVTITVDTVNVFKVNLNANDSKESACPIALDSGQEMTITMTGTAEIFLYEV